MRSTFLRSPLAAAFFLSGACVCAPASADSGTGWGYTDLGALDGSFVGPLPPSATGYGIGQAFAASGGVGAFSYSGSSIADASALNGASGGSYYVNAAGMVAGQGSSPSQAFLYADGKFNPLGSLGGTGTYVTGMNASGAVVGYGNEAGNASTHAFAYTGGRITDLKTLGGTSSSAIAVNNAGQVTGNSNISGDAASHAFLYAQGGMTDLGTLGGTTSAAIAINGSGIVIGNSTLGGNASKHAFEYIGGSMIDIGTLGGTTSTAVAINSTGMVIGNATTASNAATHAFIFADGKMTDLGTLGGSNSYALGMNSFGDVIGMSTLAGSTVQHSFLYINGKMSDLSTLFPGVTSFVAAGINDAKQIIGTATTQAGSIRGLIVSAVPETQGFMLMVAGFAALATIGRRRRGL